MNGPLPEKAPCEHPVARDSHPQPVALGGRGALRRTEVPPWIFTVSTLWAAEIGFPDKHIPPDDLEPAGA